MVIDFRVRPPFKENLEQKLFQKYRKTNPGGPAKFSINCPREAVPSWEEESIDLFMKEMDESAIKLGVMMGRSSEGTNFNAGNTNASAAALMKQYPDRFRALAAIEPRALNAVEQIEQWTSQDGFVGVCMDPGWSIPSLYPDDEVIDPVYKYCEEHDLIVSIALSPPICKDLSYVDPLHVQKVAQKFPKLKIVIPHGAFPFFHTAISVAIFCPNVYLLPDLYLALPGAYMADDLVTAANYFAKGKILFASSYPAVGMGQSVRAWKSRKFSEEGLRLAMYESAARLLKL